MKVIALLALAGSAAAFAPAQQSRASTSLAAFENEVGVQAPVSFIDEIESILYFCFKGIFNLDIFVTRGVFYGSPKVDMNTWILPNL